MVELFLHGVDDSSPVDADDYDLIPGPDAFFRSLKDLAIYPVALNNDTGMVASSLGRFVPRRVQCSTLGFGGTDIGSLFQLNLKPLLSSRLRFSEPFNSFVHRGAERGWTADAVGTAVGVDGIIDDGAKSRCKANRAKWEQVFSLMRATSQDTTMEDMTIECK